MPHHETIQTLSIQWTTEINRLKPHAGSDNGIIVTALYRAYFWG
jgi:hypothetical protein